MQQQYEQLAEPMVAPPQGAWEALWPTVQHLFTPSTLGAIALVIFVTHAIKTIASYTTAFDDSKEAWVFFCTVLSMIVGFIVGFSFWMGGISDWPIILLTTFGAGPVWRLTQALLPAKVADVLLTDTDRRWRA